MNPKTIYLLLGAKGSGKSYIGGLMQEHFGIHFLRVEDRAKMVKRDRDIDDETYLKDVFKAIENYVRESLSEYSQVVFESTGLTVYFDEMLENLKADFRVVKIAVRAHPSLCLQRVKFRDQSIHIHVSDQQVQDINRRVLEKNIQTDFELNNDYTDHKDLGLLLSQVSTILS